eukprot:2303159-Lingulodinium_polyedra.AAC.1
MGALAAPAPLFVLGWPRPTRRRRSAAHAHPPSLGPTVIVQRPLRRLPMWSGNTAIGFAGWLAG